MFKINAILHASVIVADTKTALAFYQGVLGLEPDPARPDLGYPGAWLNLGLNPGAQQIHLLELPNPDPVDDRPQHGGRDRHTAFAVDSIEELAQSLSQHGVDYSLSRSGRRALFCRDPDGNALEFIEVLID